jgi:glycosyltransferase involved in cell wall biosynthesis
MRKLNIVMVSGHACVRVQKMALPLLQDGHNVHLVAQKIPSFWESYKTVSMYSDAGQLINIIDLFEKSNAVDIYHCHNEPSWFVTLLKERTKKPVILDVHDTFLTRLTSNQEDNMRNAGADPVRVTSEERTNFQLADGLIFVSDPVRKITCEEFNLNQPNIAIPQYVPEFLYKYNLGRWLGGLVYEGKVMLPVEIKEHDRAYGFDYCDYTEVASKCAKTGIDFHLYAARNEPEFEKYFEGKAFIHNPVPYRELLSGITKHDWGLVGNLIDSPQWQTTLANKFFEYIAAGVPIVAINAGACSDIIKEFDIGITVDSIEELAERWPQHREKRGNLIKRRNEFTMESHLSELTDFYEKFL